MSIPFVVVSTASATGFDRPRRQEGSVAALPPLPTGIFRSAVQLGNLWQSSGKTNEQVRLQDSDAPHDGIERSRRRAADAVLEPDAPFHLRIPARARWNRKLGRQPM